MGVCYRTPITFFGNLMIRHPLSRSFMLVLTLAASHGHIQCQTPTSAPHVKRLTFQPQATRSSHMAEAQHPMLAQPLLEASSVGAYQKKSRAALRRTETSATQRPTPISSLLSGRREVQRTLERQTKALKMATPLLKITSPEGETATEYAVPERVMKTAHEVIPALKGKLSRIRAIHPLLNLTPQPLEPKKSSSGKKSVRFSEEPRGPGASYREPAAEKSSVRFTDESDSSSLAPEAPAAPAA